MQFHREQSSNDKSDCFVHATVCFNEKGTNIDGSHDVEPTEENIPPSLDYSHVQSPGNQLIDDNTPEYYPLYLSNNAGYGDNPVCSLCSQNKQFYSYYSVDVTYYSGGSKEDDGPCHDHFLQVNNQQELSNKQKEIESLEQAELDAKNILDITSIFSPGSAQDNGKGCIFDERNSYIDKVMRSYDLTDNEVNIPWLHIEDAVDTRRLTYTSRLVSISYMLADLGTKPLNDTLHRHLKYWLMGEHFSSAPETKHHQDEMRYMDVLQEYKKG